jgi:hypothetical protein
MFKSRGRHAAPRGRLVGPLFALEALMVTYAAKREFDSSVAAQLAEIARGGAL